MSYKIVISLFFVLSFSIQMNLGQQDYQVLTTLFQENLKEGQDSYAHQG